MSKIPGLSIVLPTINEAENLKKLIPQIVSEVSELSVPMFEVIIVDDGSTDNTSELVENLSKEFQFLQIIQRDDEPSLPLSIWEGIQFSKYDYVLWMDADGSMPAKTVRELIEVLNHNKNSVIVGSRFIDGGGYKGVRDLEETSLFNAIKNVKNSNDSVFGMLFSIIFNKFLKILFKTSLTDITSGFIVGKKEYFKKESFINANYGDYFIYLVSDFIKNKVDIIEIGYICETRMFGTSKTASNIFQLIRRGIPYIKVAIKIRKK
ncbi:glycosyltransferase [Acidimicrobiia bacterium]|nr:glycosyltransferase [Acidimicrobiia bacterium]MDC0595346.1 glycosyltransferase [Acidimicrobiia bacterium]